MNSFFPINPNDGIGRAKNVPPGLVVDTDIVWKTHFDYYLRSREGIQRTGCPTRYYVLWNSNKYTADELQKIALNLV